MNSYQGQQGPLFLGIDGGGSKCRVVIVSAANQILGEGLGGPANPLRGMAIATDSILTATHQALKVAGLPESAIADLIVGAGLAGVNIPHYYQLFASWQHPFAEFHLTSDLHIACIGAHDGAEGAVIIAGTGSCGLADVKGQILDIGGHGFPYGDNGSGAWFGMQLVHHVLLGKDKLIPTTLMTELLCKELGVSDTLDLVNHFMHATPTIYARYAPLVFQAAEQGDALALQVVKQGAAYINQLAWKLFELEPPRFSMIGGLAYKLVPYLALDVQQRLTPALAAPEFGAVWYAKQQHAVQLSAPVASVHQLSE